MIESLSAPRVADVTRPNNTSAPPRRLYVADYVLLAAFALALFIVMDPFDYGFERPALTKHLPLLVEALALSLALMSHALRSPLMPKREPQISLLRVGLPLALLGTWIAIGSSYARFVDDIQETFLNTGLYMLSSFAVAWSMRVCADHERLVLLLCRMLALSSAFMIVRMGIIHDLSGGRYHELEYLVIPVAVFFALRPAHSRALRVATTMFFLLGGAVIMKNTAFIVIAITALYLWAVRWRFLFRSSANTYGMVVVAAVGLLFAGAVALQTSNSSSDVQMPSGNPGYRIRTYERAIARFEESPAWGTLFDARSTVRFTAFFIDDGDQLPTHSDVLDLAAHGGVVALGLLAWAYIRIGRVVHRALLREEQTTELGAAAHMFFCMSLAAIAVYGFNPVMLQPDKALLLWSPLGVLLGCCVHVKRFHFPDTGDQE